jgi:SAM-dependent methyltransferase
MRIPQLPRGLWWDHNRHYHRWLLRQLPARFERGLDVGCDAGLLASRLGERAAQIDAVDTSAAMIDRARALFPAPNVQWLSGEVLQLDVCAGYDVVTAVSSMHHLPPPIRAGPDERAGATRRHPGGGRSLAPGHGRRLCRLGVVGADQCGVRSGVRTLRSDR